MVGEGLAARLNALTNLRTHERRYTMPNGTSTMQKIRVGSSQIEVKLDQSFTKENLSRFLDKIILDKNFRAKAKREPVSTLKSLGIAISKKDRDALQRVTIAEAMKASRVRPPEDTAAIPPVVVLVLVVVAVITPSC